MFFRNRHARAAIALRGQPSCNWGPMPLHLPAPSRAPDVAQHEAVGSSTWSRRQIACATRCPAHIHPHARSATRPSQRSSATSPRTTLRAPRPAAPAHVQSRPMPPEVLHCRANLRRAMSGVPLRSALWRHVVRLRRSVASATGTYSPSCPIALAPRTSRRQARGPSSQPRALHNSPPKSEQPHTHRAQHREQACPEESPKPTQPNLISTKCCASISDEPCPEQSDNMPNMTRMGAGARRHAHTHLQRRDLLLRRLHGRATLGLDSARERVVVPVRLGHPAVNSKRKVWGPAGSPVAREPKSPPTCPEKPTNAKGLAERTSGRFGLRLRARLP